MKNFYALIVAAGSGQRFGAETPKQFLPLGGLPVLHHSVRRLQNHPACAGVKVVIAPEHRTAFESVLNGLELVEGGTTRRESVHNGLKAYAQTLPDNALILIHDAARPLLSATDLNALLAALETHPCATLAAAVTDTLYRGAEPIPREGLWAMQTPQAFPLGLILTAHNTAPADQAFTDDVGLMLQNGHHVQFVAACAPNFKITQPQDFAMAQTLLHPETRHGQGFDVHAFDPQTQGVTAIRLCGVDVPFSQKLLGHSDADVGLHALTDALLGAIGTGDIGVHFPPTDAAYKNMDSAVFLAAARDKMVALGGRLINADITLICESPKIGPHREAMQRRIAEILQASPARINIKATTTEGLGFTGRREGIAAQACVSIEFPRQAV